MKLIPIALLLASCGVEASNDPDVLAARAAWGVLQMRAVVLEEVSQAVIDAECSDHPVPEWAWIQGCARQAYDTILVVEDLEPDLRAQVILHEFGHLIRAKSGHLGHTTGGQIPCLDTPGEDVMCPAGAWPGTQPTARDLAFVRH